MHRTSLSVLSLASALPIAIVLLFGIWAPAAVVWETFGVHYTAMPTLALGYHFIGNAMGFAVLYAYFPSYVAHYWLDPAQPSTLQLYSLMLYALHAVCMLAVAVWMAGRPLAIGSKVVILTVAGILPLWVAGTYINVLTVNYFWLLLILLPLAATLWVEAMSGELHISRTLAGFIGFAVAGAICTKFTYALMLVPFIALPLFFAGTEGRGRNIAIALVSCVLSSIALAFIYFVGHIEYAERFANDLVRRYSTGYLSQRNAALWGELTAWPNIKSPLQSCAALALAATALGVARVLTRRTLPGTFFLTLTIGVGILLVPFLAERAAGNTFVDVILFLSFVTATWSAVSIGDACWRPGISLFAVYVVLTGWQVFGVFKLQEWVPRLSAASAASLEVAADIAGRQPLASVYYWRFRDGRGPVWHGAPLWASPYLYALVSGEQATKRSYLRTYFPTSNHRSVLDGLLKEPHVLVVQEHLRKDSPLAMAVFGGLPAFDVLLADGRHTCRRHHVEMAWTDFDSRGGSVVTVCSVP